MAAVEEIRLGPFVGGLNTFSDPTAIADTEIAELLNFELDIDGSLVNRPPIAQIGATLPGSNTYGIDVLGFFEADGGGKYLVASNRNNATYYFDGASWVLITNTLAATAMVQYRNKAWLVAPIGSATNGGSWSPTSTFAADANMPKGGCAAVYKDRIFIGPGFNAPTNGARLYLSDLNAVWPSTPNFFNVGAGDGQNIVDLAIYSDSIVIFKQGSTYRYAYSNSPANGSTIPISYNIGALTKGCYAAYQNQLFVLFDNKVYEFSSFNYNELNMKVPLKALNPSAVLAESASISAWSDRVIVEYFDQTYVYSLRTRSWTVWDSTVAPFLGRFWPIPGRQTSEPTAYTYSTAKTGYLGLFIIKDAITSTQEEMLCRVVTKNYDYLNSARFKRLIGWGVDTISKIKIDAYAVPVTYATDITWDRLRNGPGGDGGYAWAGKRINYVANPNRPITSYQNGTGETSVQMTSDAPVEVAVWRNKCPNPSFEVDVSGVVTSAATVTRVTSPAGAMSQGVAAMAVTTTGAASNSFIGETIPISAGDIGKYVAFAVDFRKSSAALRVCRLGLQFRLAGVQVGVVQYNAPVAFGATHQRMNVSTLIPPGVDDVRVLAYGYDTDAMTIPVAAGLIWHTDGWACDIQQLQADAVNSVMTYMDGATATVDLPGSVRHLTKWDGAVNLSASTKYATITPGAVGPTGKPFVRRVITNPKSGGTSGGFYRSPANIVPGKIGDYLSYSMYYRMSDLLNIRFSSQYRNGLTPEAINGPSVLSTPDQWVRLTSLQPPATSIFDGFQMWAAHMLNDIPSLGSYLDYADGLTELNKPIQPYFDSTTLDIVGDPSWLDPMSGLANSTQYDYKPQGYTWGYLKVQGATWDRLIDPAVIVTDQVDTGGSGSGRKYVKFKQSMRFRQIGYRLEATTKGDTLTAPLRIFNLMTYVADKQKVSKKIS